jgi:hypothetical protein
MYAVLRIKAGIKACCSVNQCVLRLGLALVQIERPLGRSARGVRFSLLQQFFELFVTDLIAVPMGRETLFKQVVAAGGFALQRLNGSLQIFNHRLAFRFTVQQNRACLGIDLEDCAATGARQFNELIRFGTHTGIVAQPERTLRL